MLARGGRLASNTVSVMGCGSSLEISGQKIDIKQGNAKKPIEEAKKPVEEVKKSIEEPKRSPSVSEVQSLTRNRTPSLQNSASVTLGSTGSLENEPQVIDIPQVPQIVQTIPKTLPKSTSFTVNIEPSKNKKKKGKKTKLKKESELIEEKQVQDKKQEINTFFLEHWTGIPNQCLLTKDSDIIDNANRLYTRFGTSQLLEALSYPELSQERIKSIIFTFYTICRTGLVY